MVTKLKTDNILYNMILKSVFKWSENVTFYRMKKKNERKKERQGVSFPVRFGCYCLKNKPGTAAVGRAPVESRFINLACVTGSSWLSRLESRQKQSRAQDVETLHRSLAQGAMK